MYAEIKRLNNNYGEECWGKDDFTLYKFDDVLQLDLINIHENAIMIKIEFVTEISFNKKTEGFMVIDIDDKNLNYDAAFAVTTNPLINFPCARSLFKMENFLLEMNSIKIL